MTARELQHIKMTKQFADWLKTRVDELLLTKPEFSGQIGITFNFHNGNVSDKTEHTLREYAQA